MAAEPVDFYYVKVYKKKTVNDKTKIKKTTGYIHKRCKDDSYKIETGSKQFIMQISRSDIVPEYDEQLFLEQTDKKICAVIKEKDTADPLTGEEKKGDLFP